MRISIITGRLSKRTASPPTRAMPALPERRRDPSRLGKNGFSAPDDGDNFFEFLWPNPTDAYRAPDWASEQVYYQIFPERFRNGEASNDPPGAEPWGAPPTRENFQGGDLRGIIEKLGYIRRSRRNVPVSHARIQSAVQPQVRHRGLFRHRPRLRHEGRSRGACPQRPQARAAGAARRRIQPLRVLLAAVSGCGAKRRKLRLCLLVFPAELPGERKAGKLRLRRPLQMDAEDQSADAGARDYFITVGKYWIRNFHIDGCGWMWRTKRPRSSGSIFRRDQKGNPEALLLGETWADAHRLLAPDRARQRDELSLPGRRRGLARKGSDIARGGSITGSTGCSRSIHGKRRCGSITRSTATIPSASAGSAATSGGTRLPAALQMTFPGCPAVFYGDEIGLSGGNDPDCRLAMEWDEEKQDKELLALYRKLIGIRRESPSLLRGDFRTCLCDDASNVYAFRRTCGEDESLVVLNAGSEPVKTKIAAEGTWTPASAAENLYPRKAAGSPLILRRAPRKYIRRKRRDENEEVYHENAGASPSRSNDVSGIHCVRIERSAEHQPRFRRRRPPENRRQAAQKPNPLRSTSGITTAPSRRRTKLL